MSTARESMLSIPTLASNSGVETSKTENQDNFLVRIHAVNRTQHFNGGQFQATSRRNQQPQPTWVFYWISDWRAVYRKALRTADEKQAGSIWPVVVDRTSSWTNRYTNRHQSLRNTLSNRGAFSICKTRFSFRWTATESRQAPPRGQELDHISESFRLEKSLPHPIVLDGLIGMRRGFDLWTQYEYWKLIWLAPTSRWRVFGEYEPMQCKTWAQTGEETKIMI